ncbi:hypothetical protein KJS94_14705 [Flavihumibacter rivuli]|uniref:hypothetical protein n=1 Tax=Flavihumibacter rivuli TaxID=2838156 RepID=UPI001BDF4B80|nr:hypothetical protein [Flavihumibacter rivuli]ULQ55898.1 hypothetical protein KJS94_14705 [Flavihumibacter rivuli]
MPKLFNQYGIPITIGVPIKLLVPSGLLVGTLDLIGAIIHRALVTHKNPVSSILTYIASGLFGSEARTGGSTMIAAGIIIHYSIAMTFTIFFFWILSNTPFRFNNWVLNGIGIGGMIWLVMNYMVLPLSNIPKLPDPDIKSIMVSNFILITSIGCPIAYIYSRWESKHPTA